MYVYVYVYVHVHVHVHVCMYLCMIYIWHRRKPEEFGGENPFEATSNALAEEVVHGDRF